MSVLSFRVVRSAQASWQGTLSDGSGQIALGSGAFAGPYSLRARALAGTEITLEASVAGD